MPTRTELVSTAKRAIKISRTQQSESALHYLEHDEQGVGGKAAADMAAARG